MGGEEYKGQFRWDLIQLLSYGNDLVVFYSCFMMEMLFLVYFVDKEWRFGEM